MWSNISAPKSQLKSAQVGHQTASPTSLAGASSGGPGGSSPLMRYKHAVCASATTGFIYIHGGRLGNGIHLDDDVWRFDPHENAWLQLRTGGCKPPGLQEHSLAEYRNQLYLFGGQVSAASGQDNSFWRLDLATGQWASLNLKSSMRHGAYLGPSNRRAHSAVLHRDSLYIFGGYEDFRGSSNQLWQYDLLNERWELRNLSSSSAYQPEPRHGHSAIVYNDSMYVYGGLNNLKPLGDLWRWSWRERRWMRERTRGRAPGQLHGHTAVQAFGSMFVFGGERPDGRASRSLWRLNLSNLSWQKIRPKGPRPSASTWHAAIANPMHALDQANYLIEADPADEPEESEHSGAVSCHRLAALNSLSDNCFLQTQTSATSRLRETTPMELVRPNEGAGAQAQDAPSPSRHFKRPAGSSNYSLAKASASEHQICSIKASSSICGKTSKLKRRLRLNFLGRQSRKAKQGGEKCGNKCAGAMEPLLRRPMAASRSATSVMAAGADSQQPSNECHSANGTQVPVKSEPLEVEMAGEPVEERPTNARILESLDTDIKQMFCSALGPFDEEQRLQSNGNHEQAGNHDERDQLALDDEENKRERRLARDSLTQSHLSSYLAPPGSRATLSSHTYRTAQEQLSSCQSTLTITNQQQQQPAPDAAPNRLAEMRHRRSVHQFNCNGASVARRPGGAERRARPKSENWQSLMNQADAKIKHFYTPLFQPESAAQQQQQQQQKQPQRNSIDLGPHLARDTATTRHNKRASLHEQQATPAARTGSGSSSHWLTASAILDRTKRHTIHQTSTYYNLYFADELEQTRAPDDLTTTSSGSTIKNARHATHWQSGHANSTTAALVGVRDGSADSSGGPRAAAGAQQDTDASVSSSLLASESHTLRAEPCGLYDELVQQHEHEQRQQQTFDGLRQGQADGGSELGADNTSLSFSVIAEFEEDDMLQYSSPSGPRRSSSEASLDYDHDQHDEPPAGASPAMELRLDTLDTTDHHEMQLDAHHEAREPPAGAKPQKSSSSGYDSVRSSSGNTCEAGVSPLARRRRHHHQQQQQLQLEPETETEPASCCADQAGGEPRQFATTDSLQALTNSSGCSAPHSPPSKSLPLSSSPEDSSWPRSQAATTAARYQQQGRAPNSVTASLASKLFGARPRRASKTRYWQLCMFVMGGKQQPSSSQGAPAGLMGEPINIWRLYI